MLYFCGVLASLTIINHIDRIFLANLVEGSVIEYHISIGFTKSTGKLLDLKPWIIQNSTKCMAWSFIYKLCSNRNFNYSPKKTYTCLLYLIKNFIEKIMSIHPEYCCGDLLSYVFQCHMSLIFCNLQLGCILLELGGKIFYLVSLLLSKILLLDSQLCFTSHKIEALHRYWLEFFLDGEDLFLVVFDFQKIFLTNVMHAKSFFIANAIFFRSLNPRPSKVHISSYLI